MSRTGLLLNTNSYSMIHKLKLSFSNVYNDLCETVEDSGMLQYTKKYQAMQPHVI